MRLSARNQLVGTVISVEDGSVTAIVTVELDGGQRVVASITKQSAADLGLVPGTEVVAVIKSSDVMIGVE